MTHLAEPPPPLPSPRRVDVVLVDINIPFLRMTDIILHALVALIPAAIAVAAFIAAIAFLILLLLMGLGFLR
jgi:hypothetical protein